MTKASKILPFQPWALGILNTSQLFKDTQNSYFLAESWQFNWARNRVFCLTYVVNWNKYLNFFKLLVAECSSCFNENIMQENCDRVMADQGLRPPQTEVGNGHEFSASWVSAWICGYRVWVWDLAGLNADRDVPGMVNSKISKRLLGSFCRGNGDTYNLQAWQWDAFFFFFSPRELSVQLRCLYAVQLLFYTLPFVICKMMPRVASGGCAALKRHSFPSVILAKIAATSDMKGAFFAWRTWKSQLHVINVG